MRRGAGKVRHVEVNQLWAQDTVAEGNIDINKVSADSNRADFPAKHLDRSKLKRTKYANTIEKKSMEASRLRITQRGKILILAKNLMVSD